MFTTSDSASIPARPGASYGHRKLQSLSILPHTGSSNDLPSPREQADLSNKHILKKIRDWFETWRPWQQRMLVCGLTDRCPKNQLESLATVMEPVFHRDFVACLKQRYPSAPFRKIKEMALLRERWKKQRLKAQAEELKRRLMEALPEIDQKDEELLQELIDSCKSKPNLPNDETTRTLSEFSCQYAARIVITSLRTLEPHNNGQNESLMEDIDDQSRSQHESGSASPTHDSECSEKNSVVDSVDGKSSKSSPTEVASIKVSSGMSGCEVIDGDVKPGTNLSTVSITQKTTPEKELCSSLRGSRTVSPKADVLKIEENQPVSGAPSLTTKSVVSPGLSRDDSGDSFIDSMPGLDAEMKKRLAAVKPVRALPPLKTPPSACHRHRSAIGSSSETSTVDFFMQEQAGKFNGIMQREIRVGPVKKPSHIKDLYVPIQRCYKNVKWFGETPSQGKRFVKAHRGQLRKQFKAQLQQIWLWMSSWEDYEKMAALVEVVKMCDSDTVNYMAQCLMQRLKDRSDINRLHDHVLIYIFSMLPPQDIESAAGVCHRWKYLCSRDDLWMVKCQEMGWEEGVPNITDLVQKTNHGNDLGVDWHLAYYELKKITQETKNAIPKPDHLSIESKTPEGMVRVGGRFLPMDSDERTTTAQDSVDSRRLSHTTDLLVHRGTVSRLRQERTVDEDDDDEEEEEILSVSDEYSLFKSEKDDSSAAKKKFRKRSVRSLETNAFSVPLQYKTERGSREATAMTNDTRLDLEGMEGSPPPSTTASQKERKLKKRREEEEEAALDVRPELRQARDILGKSAPSHTLMWKSSKITMDPRSKYATYAGEVKGIQRVRKLQGHLDVVLCITFDKRRLFSGSMDRTIRIWDLRSGRSIRKLYGHMGGVRCLHVHGNTLVSGSWDMSVMVWDLVQFKRRTVYHGHRGSVSCLHFNDTHLVSGSHDKTVRVWDMTALGGCQRVITGHKMAITCLSFDGDHVFTGSSDKTIRVTDIHTGECLKEFTGLVDHITAMTVSGSLIISANGNGQVFFWNKETGELEAGVECHKAPINQVVFHQNRFLTASSDMLIKEWDLMTMTCVRYLQGHKGPVTDVGVSERYVVSCSDDGNVRIWDTVAPPINQQSQDDSIRSTIVNKQTEDKQVPA